MLCRQLVLNISQNSQENICNKNLFWKKVCLTNVFMFQNFIIKFFRNHFLYLPSTTFFGAECFPVHLMISGLTSWCRFLTSILFRLCIYSFTMYLKLEICSDEIIKLSIHISLHVLWVISLPSKLWNVH